MKDKGPVKGVGPKRVTQVGLSPVEGHKRIAQVEGPSGGQKLIFVEGEPGLVALRVCFETCSFKFYFILLYF
jgi:hypothetical protein